MRARDIIIVVVARGDRVASLAGSIGTPRDARARSKDEGWVGCIFFTSPVIVYLPIFYCINELIFVTTFFLLMLLIVVIVY